MNKKKTTEQFIQEAREIHGDKYDYSKTDLEHRDEKGRVCIVCSIHGEFWQTPYDHLRGRGCRKCGIEKCSEQRRKTINKFVEEAKNVHGEKYDYSNVVYKGNHEDVEIICPIHGSFKQSPTAHILQKQGCPECGRIKANSSKRKTTEQFIKESNKIHNNIYDYSLTEYLGATEEVKIICKKHGVFKIQANHHLEGCGCQKCKFEENAQKQRLTNELFIKKSINIHGNKYDYSKINYIDSKTKLFIVCPIHGGFLQRPNDHLSGRGCFKCNQSHLEKEVELLLKEKMIENINQKKFDWLGRQTLDFYLPKYNIGIECQGEQHFKPIEHFGGEEAFECTIRNDFLKKKLCEENGLKLLYYSNLNIDFPYEVITSKEELLVKIC